MSILVTGSSGRIGSALVRALTARGEAVVGLDRRPLADPPAGWREVIADLHDPVACAAAVAGARAVVHLGAFMSWKAEDEPALHRANVEGTRVLAAAARQAGIRRFVLASSGEVHPENAPEYLPIDEHHPTNPRSVYGLTKLLSEEIVRFHGRVGAFETVILRFSHTQDAHELLDPASFFSGPRFFLRPRIRQQEAFGNHAVASLLRAADPGRDAMVLARNQDGRPFRMHITDTRDMVAGLLLALAHPAAAGRVFNLGSTEPVDFGEWLPRMAAITGLPLVTVDLPGAGVFYETSNAAIRSTLGFEPRFPFAIMLEEAAASWRARGG